MISELNLSYWSRSALGLLLSLTGGLAFVLAFPPYEIWPLALVGLVPILVAQHRVMPPRISSLAPAVGVAIWLQDYFAGFIPLCKGCRKGRAFCTRFVKKNLPLKAYCW